MRFISLFSGSSGNCLLAAHHKTTLLIDAGLSGKKIQTALTSVGIDPAKLSGILITHEHRDHIHGVGILSRRFHLPVYANLKTWQAMAPEIGDIEDRFRMIFENDRVFNIQDLLFKPFSTSHDAADSVGFVIDDGKRSMAIATDTGIITPEIRNALKNRHLVVLESNHDLGMLETGSYPFPLKQRIRGQYGHLSNHDAAAMLCDLVESGTAHLVLAHLSAENNYPLLAYQTAEQALTKKTMIVGKDVTLEVAGRNQISHYYEF